MSCRVLYRELWQGKSVLVVDDSVTSRTLIEQLLKKLPLEVGFVSSAEEFRRASSRSTFDLVIMDYRLPDEDGLRLLREFRQGCDSAAVVVVTGNAEVQTATEALTGGADGFVDKRHLKQGPAAFQATLERAILRSQKIKAELELEGLKREFQALLTHDLRNPAACASVALKMYKENPREEVLETAMESLDRFFSRLDRYQVFSSLDGGLLELEMERGSLRELICAVVEELLPLAEEKRQTVLWAPPDLDCDCAFDRTWLYHALENLIENAIKYSGFEGRIEVRLAVTEQKATVVVSDNGPGIQPEFQPLLFRRFYRAEKTRTTEGIGLGLLIVKRVVEAHGGTVEVHSEGVAGEGASFSMFLPLGRD